MRHRSRVSKPRKKRRKKQNFFTNLPSEIIIDILSRLPVRTIISCKCVCKPWLNLLGTEEFAKSHLSKSVSGFAVTNGRECNIYEFDDVLNLVHHDHHYIPVTSFDGPGRGLILGSANGLLLHSHLNLKMLYDEYCITNPITQEKMLIPDPCKSGYGDDTFGFGASRITGQLKVVRIFHDYPYPDDEEKDDLRFPASACQVYTLGTRLWRSINPGPILEYYSVSYGVFLNGNLYWLVFDSNDCPLISCFDLEGELFSIFPSPPDLPSHRKTLLCLCALEDCLCLSDNVSDDEFVIWLMKDYGVEKSWTKDYVISKSLNPNLHSTTSHLLAYPIKVFKDGDILMAWQHLFFFYYSTETKTSHMINILERPWEIIRHAPSFISLKRFVKEKVCAF